MFIEITTMPGEKLTVSLSKISLSTYKMARIGETNEAYDKYFVYSESTSQSYHITKKEHNKINKLLLDPNNYSEAIFKKEVKETIKKEVRNAFERMEL